MQKLREQLDRLLDRLRSNERKLEVAGNRWLQNHDLAHREHGKQKKAEAKLAKAEANERPQLQKFWEGRAARRRHKATKAHLRAQFWVGKAKQYAKAVGKLKGAIDDHESEIKKIEREQGPKRVAPNKIRGGAERQALLLFMHLSMRFGAKFYSQEGPTDVFHGITGPTRKHRHDCSSWFTSGYCTCGLRNPNKATSSAGSHNFSNDETVFTGTLGENGEIIREDDLDTGDAILFGFAPFEHVEMKHGHISKSKLTVGHGDEDINWGNTELLPGHREFRRYVKN